jgi:hypothetical protein
MHAFEFFLSSDFRFLSVGDRGFVVDDENTAV